MTRTSAADLVAAARSQIEELTVAELQEELASGECTVVDIRDFRERYELGVIAESISAPRGMLEFWVDAESPYHQDRFQTDKRYVLHCAAGWRSALAAVVMQDLGYTNVAHLETGFNGWRDAGAPTEDIKATSKWIKRSDLTD